MSGFISFLHMCDDEVSILLKMRSCCIEGTERKGNKEDIAFITLARSHVTFKATRKAGGVAWLPLNRVLASVRARAAFSNPVFCD
jgi:hypothetical protein